ncbi:MAG: UDP-3-O-acyl-N-acetylglucosamine deacetylase [Alphaproteobacteria bacterium]|nr:UDP-3-O-acyl-N-acetylglucosamine deacetylase [Alphaproteobacteria bacterium]
MRTLKDNVLCSGVGIHSGEPVNMIIRPFDKPGIFFRRVDLDDKNLIPATYDNVSDTKMRNTTIGNLKGAHVKTIEHLMAALFVAGVDSALVDVDGAEVPIMNGSASLFYRRIMEAGITKGAGHKKIVVKKTVVATAREMLRALPFLERLKGFILGLFYRRRGLDGYVKLSPTKDKALNIKATLVYTEPIIGKQSFVYSFDNTKWSAENFIRNIASARTFGKYAEWGYLKAHGMARGADEKNVIVLDYGGEKTLNRIYWPDEFVRHKIIDAIGDMFTSGGFIVADLESYKGSHALNNAVLKKLFSNPDNYDIIDA